MFTCVVTKARSFQAISLAVNYHLFSHCDVSYRFNGKNDKVVLELYINSQEKYKDVSKAEHRTKI